MIVMALVYVHTDWYLEIAVCLMMTQTVYWHHLSKCRYQKICY